MAADNEELTRITQQVAYELEQFGKVSQSTADALRDAQAGVKGFSDAVRKMPAQVGGAATDLAKAMYTGEKGAQAFNKSIDGMASAMDSAITILTALIPGGPLIKATVMGLGLLAKTLVKTAAEVEKAANIQGDALYNTYQKLGKAGAVAAGGTTQLGADLRKLGLGFQEADQMISLFTENSRDLALFGKTAFEGAQQFTGIADASKGLREQYRLLGMSQEDQNEAIMGYVKIQTRMGNAGRVASQGFEATAQAALKYTQEQDALTKLTGISRKEQEKALDEAMRNARFAATIDELVASGRQDEAKQLQFMVQASGKYGASFQKGMQDIASGFVNTAEARQVLMSSQGEALKAVENAKAGQIKGQDELYKSFGGVVNKVGETGEKLRGLTKAVGDTGTFLPYHEQRMAKQEGAASDSFVKNMKAAEKAVADQEKGLDERLSNQAKTDIAQQDATLATQALVDKAITPATRATLAMAEAAKIAAEKLLQLAGASEASAKREAAAKEEYNKAFENATTLQKLGVGRTTEQQGADARLKFAQGDTSQTLSDMAKGKATTVGKETYMWDDQKFKEKDKKSYEEYVDLKTKLYKEEIKKWKKAHPDDDMEEYDQDRIQRETELKAQTQFGGQAQAAGAKTIVPPAGAAGAAPQKTTRQDLEAAGLKLKKGDVQGEGNAVSPKLIELAKAVQSSVKGFNYFSGFNDQYHTENRPKSKHTDGMAMDFALDHKPTKEEGDAIVKQLKSMGASYALDEYNASTGGTGGHIHAEISAAKGFEGLITGPRSGYKPDITMHGAEQIKIEPLDSGSQKSSSMSAMTENMGKEFKAMFDTINQQSNTGVGEAMLAVMQDLVREVKTTNDLNKKILAANR